MAVSGLTPPAAGQQQAGHGGTTREAHRPMPGLRAAAERNPRPKFAVQRRERPSLRKSTLINRFRGRVPEFLTGSRGQRRPTWTGSTVATAVAARRRRLLRPLIHDSVELVGRDRKSWCRRGGAVASRSGVMMVPYRRPRRERSDADAGDRSTSDTPAASSPTRSTRAVSSSSEATPTSNVYDISALCRASDRRLHG